MYKWIYRTLVAGSLISNSFAQEARLQSLEKRINELEAKLLLEDHNSGNVSTFEGLGLNIGGYINVTGTSWHLPESKDQYTFDEVEFGLMMKGQLNSSLSYFIHTEFEQERHINNTHAPFRSYGDVENQVDPEDVFLTYKWNDEFSINLGALITPFGVSNREHFDFLRWQNEKPLALREASGKFLFFDDHVMGSAINYNHHLEEGFIESSLYMGSVNVGASRLVTGYRVGYQSSGGNLKIGTSFQTGQKEFHDRYYSYGLDIKAKIDRLEFRSELILSDLKSNLYNQDSNPFSFYFEPWFHLVNERHILYSRIDYLKDTVGLNKVDHDRNSSTAEISDPVEFYEFTLGYNYLPWPYWRLSFGVTQASYVGKNAELNGQSRDFTSFEWGTVLSF